MMDYIIIALLAVLIGLVVALLVKLSGKKEDAALLELPQNSPAIVTVVVWLDGDQVDNSMVSDSGKQSMSGVLNLQFASSADLMHSDQMIKGQ